MTTDDVRCQMMSIPLSLLGSASIEAVRGSSMADIVVLPPRGRCTEIQERQMTSVLDDNVHVYRVDGTSGTVTV